MSEARPEPSVAGIVSALQERDLEVHDNVRDMLTGVVSDAGGTEHLRDDQQAMNNLGILVDEVSRTAHENDRQIVDAEVMRRTFLKICPLPPWCR